MEAEIDSYNDLTFKSVESNNWTERMATDASDLANDDKLRALLVESGADEVDSDLDNETVQQVVRTLRDGRETITCWFRVTFQTGQSRQVLHIPFVPPLENYPEVDAYPTDHDDVRIRITDRQKFGIRAEIILSANPGQPTERSIEFVIYSENG